jgi:hypothetical protein
MIYVFLVSWRNHLNRSPESNSYEGYTLRISHEQSPVKAFIFDKNQISYQRYALNNIDIELTTNSLFFIEFYHNEAYRSVNLSREETKHALAMFPINYDKKKSENC